MDYFMLFVDLPSSFPKSLLISANVSIVFFSLGLFSDYKLGNMLCLFLLNENS